MSVTTEVEPINRHNGNGTTKVFAYSWKIFAEAELVVLAILGVTQLLNVHYTLTGVGQAAGGTVVFVTAPPTGTGNVVFSRDLPFTQQKVFPEATKFPTSEITEAFDRAVMIDQQLLALFARAYLIPIGEIPTDALVNVPSLANRASKFFAWDSSGQIVPAAGTSGDLTPVSGFVNTLLDDADAPTFRASIDAAQANPLDSAFRVVGSSDSTKKLADEVDGFTTATTRTQFHSDEDVLIAQPWGVTNLFFTATVAASVLTIAVTTKKGTAPTATDPVLLKFRNVDPTLGEYTVVALTSALSLDISAGSTLGTVSATAHRLYFGIANDAGTLRLFIYNPLNAVAGPPVILDLVALHENILYSSTAEGGVGGADSALTLYSATAFTSKSVRVLGYVESTQATAGTWATTPSAKIILSPRSLQTGDVVQTLRTKTGEVATGTTVLPFDDTIPQITEGVEFMTKSITPTSSINVLSIRHSGNYAHSAVASDPTCCLFRDAVANALVTVAGRLDIANANWLGIVSHAMQAGTVSAITFRIRAGAGGAGTISFNGNAGSRDFGGTYASYLEVTEIFV